MQRKAPNQAPVRKAPYLGEFLSKVFAAFVVFILRGQTWGLNLIPLKSTPAI